MEHLIEYSKTAKAKQLVDKVKRKENKTKRDKLRTRSDAQKAAQKAFNAYIRERDKGKPCISCGAIQGGSVYGGNFDAGHYKSVGSSPLRYHLWNCHLQCVKCNRHLSGNIVEYRKGLIKRIGIEKVEWLEAHNAPIKYSKEDLDRITRLAKKRTNNIRVQYKRKKIC